MSNFINPKTILAVLSSMYLIIVIFLYVEKENHVIVEAEKRIDSILKFNKALHKYVEETQKPVIYDLKAKGELYEDFFDPKILSFTYIARTIHNNYVEIVSKDNEIAYQYKLAATNPRNPINKATPYEENILNKFRKQEIKEFTDIIEENNHKYLYRAIPIAPNKGSCMLCHSSPEVAPKELIATYGDIAGFHEQIDDIRAMISLKIPVSEIIKSENTRFFFLSCIILFVFTLIYFFILQISKKEQLLAKEIIKNVEKEKKTRAILDSSPSIIVLNNGTEIIDVNKTFFEFFSEYKNISEFKSKYTCICDLFNKMDKEGYISAKTIANKTWIEHLLEHQNEIYKAAIIKNGVLNHFIVKAQKVQFQKEFLVIVELINITHEVELETKLKDKEELLQQQSKILSMNELIRNIAHQWRQPLSAISTASSGLRIQRELNLLNNDDLDNTLQFIENTTQYLSSIINDFAKLTQPSENMTTFFIKDVINEAINILRGILESKNIVISSKVDDNITLYGNKNSLLQCIVNILNNSNDVLSNKENIENVIFINLTHDNQYIYITIEDNGGGVDESILEKIFEPYFTTKHQYQGAGLGLYVVHNIITNIFDGFIQVRNEEKEINDTKYKCAVFTITIPKKSLE
jgi:signal transduction histidine kinase